MSSGVEVSVVIPTLRERDSLERLLPKLFGILDAAGISAEVVIVDDNSCDGTFCLCASLAAEHNLRLITRTDERGLSSAVLRGLREAVGEICVVMDADLSHPPEAVPALVEAARSPFCDVAIGSRYIAGGSADERWSTYRRLNSRVATFLAVGLTRAKDPLAGFFAVRRSTLERAAELRPLGYKILLELIVRCDCRRMVEVPIHFQDRALGKSKLSAAQQWLYLRHLARLYAARYLPTFLGGHQPQKAGVPRDPMPRRKSA